MQLEFGGKRVTVSAADIIIGSDPASTLVVTGLGVLPRHACVRARPDGAVEVTPGQPEALLLLNGSRVGHEPTRLVAGDRLVIGDQEVVVLEHGAAVGASHRLHDTLMGIPVMTPANRPPEPPTPPRAPPPTPSPVSGVRPGLIATAVVVVAILFYLLMIRG